MTRSLTVTMAERHVGDIHEVETGGLTFAYARTWLDDDDAFAISISLPLHERPYDGGVAHAFFANLLPEGRVRALVAQRLGISEDNDFALLAAEGPPRLDTASGYRPLTPDELAQLAKTGSVFSQLSGHDGVRLSLAGAQDKLPVYVPRDGTLSLPLGSSPSTHLLKFASRDFKHLPANEAFVGSIARDLGLPTVDAALRSIGGESHLLVDRYDRTVEDNGRVTRLHQEDMCQALGLRPGRKYEAEGGPRFAQCFRIVLDHSAEPALDSTALLRWLAFNAVVGNADGHAKNLSLVRTPGGDLRLAPFYDLVCTAAYPTLDRRLAMSVGAHADPGAIRGRDWRALAVELGVRPAYVVDLVRRTAEAATERARAVAKDFRARWGESPALQMIVPRVGKRARRTLELLGE